MNFALSVLRRIGGTGAPSPKTRGETKQKCARASLDFLARGGYPFWMTFFNRKLRPAWLVLAACVALFLLKNHEAASWEREAAPALAALQSARPSSKPLGLDSFRREYLSDPFGKAIGLSETQLRLCQQLTRITPVYESALHWRNQALLVGLLCGVWLAVSQRVLRGQSWQQAVLYWRRRLAEKFVPWMTQIQQQAARKAAERGGSGAAPHAVHNIVTCPSCSQKMRIPAGKGRIRVSCSACGTKFECVT